MKITYRNYKGEISDRRIIPLLIYKGSNEFYPQKQWLILSWDLDKKAFRTFAFKNFIYPHFYKYTKEKDGFWGVDFKTWWIEYDWCIYAGKKEFDFAIKKESENDWSLPTILFCISGPVKFSFLPRERNFKTKFKEFNIFGVNVGFLMP